jgi:unsaturated chondroitin disaccharide hydrolase
MKKNFIILSIGMFALFIASCNSSKHDAKEILLQKVDSALSIAAQQSILMAESLMDKPNQFPRSVNANGDLVTSNSEWWCSPGTLWYLYENSNNAVVKDYAEAFTLRIEHDTWNSFDHDIGFIIYCSYGNGYRLTGNPSYKPIIKSAAEKLATRMHPKTKALLSWNPGPWNSHWQYPVIIDNMMNLELLMWAGENYNDSNLINIALTHSNTTITNHYRPDNSCFHVVSYDTITGQPHIKQTAQGFSNESAWARGQSWGLYGYTMMYRESKDQKYLDQAIKIADLLVNHPNLPDDKIPYWDYDAPNIPDALRDASAGAIMASALLELSTMVTDEKAKDYFTTAEKQIETLCGSEYIAKEGENGHFILKHSVGHMPMNSEVDVPLSYADYYFVEALIRYKNLKEN